MKKRLPWLVARIIQKSILPQICYSIRRKIREFIQNLQFGLIEVDLKRSLFIYTMTPCGRNHGHERCWEVTEVVKVSCALYLPTHICCKSGNIHIYMLVYDARIYIIYINPVVYEEQHIYPYYINEFGAWCSDVSVLRLCHSNGYNHKLAPWEILCVIYPQVVNKRK